MSLIFDQIEGFFNVKSYLTGRIYLFW